MIEEVDVEIFTVSVQDGNPSVVRLVGELDLAGVPRLTTVLASLDGNLELDCSQLSFIDAAGLRALQDAHHARAARGATLVITNPSRLLLRLIGLLGLDTVLEVRALGDGLP